MSKESSLAARGVHGTWPSQSAHSVFLATGLGLGVTYDLKLVQSGRISETLRRIPENTDPPPGLEMNKGYNESE